MKTALDILEIAVMVVYLVMVVYILWTNDKLRKALMFEQQCHDSALSKMWTLFDFYHRRGKEHADLQKKYQELQLAHERLRRAYERKVKECEHLQPSVSDIALSIEKEDLKQKNDELKEKCEEHCDGWDKTFEQAAQRSSKEEWEESVKKAKAEEEQ